MGKRGHGQEVLIELLEDMPSAATMTLARRAYKMYPALWPSLEACRSQIRYIRGNLGDKHRKYSSRRDLRREPEESGNPFGELPDGWEQMPGWSSVEISGPCTALVLCDLHVPYHRKPELIVALEEGRNAGADVVLLNGDIVDCYAVSHWQTDPRRRDFSGELNATREVLRILREQFADARIVYKLGNHEERLERYLACKAPELLGVEDFEIDKLLRCDEYGVSVVRDKRPIKLGELWAIHGHEYRFSISNPVNPARGLFLRGQVSAICGHFHQTSQHSEKSLAERVVSCWSVGALCDLHPDYRPLNKWNWGHAIVRVGEDGSYTVDNRRIVKGKSY